MQNIFEKEMNRRDFFRYAGSIILGVVGITHLLKTLSQHGITSRKTLVAQPSYGATPYGGPKKQ
jgi:hypothetical protein